MSRIGKLNAANTKVDSVLEENQTIFNDDQVAQLFEAKQKDLDIKPIED